MPTKKAAPRPAPAASSSKQTAKAATPAKKAATAAKTPAKAPAAATKAAPKAPAKAAPAPAKAAPAAKAPAAVKKPKKVVLDKFLLEQKAQLEEERAGYLASAAAFKAEADMLALDMEPGDVQFDEESGEGGTANVDRERDLALSAQAKLAVEEIDEALSRIQYGTYGKCASCGQQIPKPRLKAIPHASLCVACKSGGLSRR